MSGGPAGPGSDSCPRLRRYRPGDGPAVRAVHERALRDAGSDPTDVPGDDDLERVESAYLDVGGEFFVVDCGTREEPAVVATGGYKPVEGDEVGRTVELFRMAVTPEYQGEGHGTRILSGLGRRVREREGDRVVLATAARQGPAGFYATHGDRETDREPHRGYELIGFGKGL